MKGPAFDLGVAVFVERPGRPRAGGFVLVDDQPRAAALDGRDFLAESTRDVRYYRGKDLARGVIDSPRHVLDGNPRAASVVESCRA